MHPSRLKISGLITMLSLIAGCGGGGGGEAPAPAAPAPVPANPAPVPPLPTALAPAPAIQLTLSGKASDAALANATIVATVGSKTFSGTADAAGSFRLPLTSASATDMVTVTAQGVGAKSHVKLINLVGDTATAQAMATASGEVSVNVSVVSTAWYATLLRQNGGAVPATQAVIDAAAPKIHAYELFQLAAVIKLIASPADGQPALILPAGVPDTTALTAPGAWQVLVRSAVMADQDRISDAATRLANDSAVAIPVNVRTAPFVMSYAPGVTCCVDGGRDVALRADGSATVSDFEGTYPATWINDGGAIRITLATPRIENDYRGSGDTGVTTGYILRHFVKGATATAAAFTDTGYYREPGNPFNVPFGPGNREAFAWTGMDRARVVAPTAGDLAGTTLHGVPDLRTVTSTGFRQIAVTFNADGSARTAELPALTIQWKIVDSKLVLTYSDGVQQTLGRFSTLANGLESWYAGEGTAAAYRVTTPLMVHQAQAGAAFTETSAMAAWRSQVFGTELYNNNLYINVLANRRLTEDNERLDGSVTLSSPASWSIENGRLAMRTYLTAAGDKVATCPIGQVCTLSAQRIWTLLRDDGTDIIVFELRGVGSDTQYRINRYSRRKA